MIELLVIVARVVQFSAAVALFGSPLFFLYALGATSQPSSPTLAWGRGLVRLAGGLLVVGALASLFGQTAAMAGDPAMAFDADALGMVLTGTTFGYAILARLALAVSVVLLALRLPPGRRLWGAAAGAGGLILASFAWTGHGATEEGLGGVIHAASDVVHLIAAGVWLGALAALSVLLWNARKGVAGPANLAALYKALESFSGVGSLVVAALLASGLVNSLFLVGLARLGGLVTTPYGWLLLMKLGIFGVMVLLAATNRFRLTPGLGRALRGQDDMVLAADRLRRSIFIETGLGLGILILVSVLGMLAPVSAQT